MPMASRMLLRGQARHALARAPATPLRLHAPLRTVAVAAPSTAVRVNSTAAAGTTAAGASTGSAAPPAKRKRVRVAMLGAGDISNLHAQGLNLCESAELVRACARRTSARNPRAF